MKDERNFVYKHEKEYEIRYTDVDVKDNLKLSSLLGIMLESACRSADELGFGYEPLKAKNYGFILVNWYIKLDRVISLDDVKIRVVTWPIKPQRMQVFRDFELYCGDEKVGAAVSRWCIVDLANFSLKPSSSVFGSVNVNFNDFRCMEFNDWKLMPQEGDKVYSRTIGYSDCDHYNHVNNTVYANFIMDVFDMEFLKKNTLSSVQITYVKQCKEGEAIDFYKFYDGEYYHIEGCADGEPRVRCRLKFNEV